MKHISGDIFTVVPQYNVQAVVMPVSGYVKKDLTCMVGGISKIVQDRLPDGVDAGKALVNSNGGVCHFGSWDGVDLVAFPDRPRYTFNHNAATPISLIPSARETFRGKPLSEVPRWALEPTYEALNDACHQLVALRNKKKWERVAILRPSYPLPFADVKVMMEGILNDFFALVTKGGKEHV